MNDMQLIEARQLAELLQVSTRTLWRLVAKGDLPPPIYVGRSTRWRVDSIRQWLDERSPPLPAGKN